MRVERYDSSLMEIWDRFVRKSKNGTFLFLRNYMDYHSDRFPDHSLVVWSGKQEPIALLPACIDATGILTSHGGLTYGGFITDENMKIGLMMDVFEEAVNYLSAEGIAEIQYKTVPHIYHGISAEEDRYCLFRLGAQLVRCDALTVIDYGNRLPYQERRRRSIRKARQNSMEVLRTEDYASFWEILTGNLVTHHKVSPVHTLAEIEHLASRFPGRIQLLGAFHKGEMLAGSLLYVSRNVVHIQYAAASEAGRQSGALDLINEHLITRHCGPQRYLDFGISTECGGRILNRGLAEYKEGFGGRAVTHEHFKLSIAQ